VKWSRCNKNVPVPVPTLSRAWVCGFSLAEIVGSNLAGGMDVCCECCVLSGRGLCVGLITRPEESYRVWCVWLWSSIVDNKETLAQWGCCAMVKKNRNLISALPSAYFMAVNIQVILLKSGSRTNLILVYTGRIWYLLDTEAGPQGAHSISNEQGVS